jgi:hypothetical protein
MVLTDVKKRSIFRALATKSQYAVGVEFGLDKHYKSNIGVINAVNKIYKEVKEHPEKYAIASDVVKLVEESMLERRTSATRSLINLKEPQEVDEKQLVLGVKNKAWDLLNKKLDYLYKNPRAFRNESVMNLAKLAGIVFDKSQIVKGEATEHISIKAKIDPNISSEEALSQLLRIREATLAEED